MKKTLVELTNSELGVTRKFEISHAERLLRMPNNAGWKLADKNYTYDEENGIVRRNTQGAANPAQ